MRNLKNLNAAQKNGSGNCSTQGKRTPANVNASTQTAAAKKRKQYYVNDDGKFEGVIYERYNRHTKKSYVGEAANEATRIASWKNSSNNSYGGKKITEARKKYGVGSDVWNYNILEKVFADTEEELEELLEQKETDWIYRKDSVNNGYNGSYGKGNLGMDFTAEHREKISANHRNYQSEEAKQKISASNTGRTLTPETRAKISEKNTGKKRTPQQKAAESSRMKNDPNLSERIANMNAARKAKHAIYGNPRKGSKVTDPAVLQKMKALQQARGTKVSAIAPDGTRQDYPTMLDAAKATGHGAGSVLNNIRTGGVTRKGYRFTKLP